jgi:lipopolysaccharide export system protein LptC
MTAAPLPVRHPTAPPTIVTSRLRHGPLDARLVRRRWMVAVAKRLLPVAALALLSLVALWPEIANQTDRARLTYRRGGVESQSGQLTDATYHGVDSRDRPYTMTASIAQQVTPERINLTDPKADMTLESGNWLLVQSRQGVYLQHVGSLDLSGDVRLYRDDGTTLTTSTATMDLKSGAATSAEMTHAEGPFGALDAQGFTLTDKGAVIQFAGPGRLVLNAAHAATPATSPAGGAQTGSLQPGDPQGSAPTAIAPGPSPDAFGGPAVAAKP